MVSLYDMARVAAPEVERRWCPPGYRLIVGQDGDAVVIARFPAAGADWVAREVVPEAADATEAHRVHRLSDAFQRVCGRST